MPQIEVSEAAFSFLKRHAEPLTDTTVTVLDRLFAELEYLREGAGAPRSLEMRFSGADLPSVKFTTILSANVAGKPATKKSWNHILEDLIAACVMQGASPQDVRGVLQANLMNGEVVDNGYRFVPAAGFSYQGLEATRVCRNLAILCERFRVPVDIEFRWQDEEKAAFPNQSARIVLP